MKRIWKYIAHFWYVAVNWDIVMACFMAYDNIRGTRKYGTGTFIPAELKTLTIAKGDAKNGSRYEAVSFYMLETLFDAFRKLSPGTTLVDLGCGKGRVMMVAPHFGFETVTGIDFAAELCEEAAVNMQKKEQEFPGLVWKVLNETVEDYAITPEDSVFFMFNPFTEVVLHKFLENLDRSCDQFPRTIYFLYASPQHQNLLLDRGYAMVFRKKKMYLESVIAVRE